MRKILLYMFFLMFLFFSCGVSKNTKKNIELSSIYKLTIDWQPEQNIFTPFTIIQNNLKEIYSQSKDTAILICDILILKQDLFNLKCCGQSYGLYSENDKINEITKLSIKYCFGSPKLTKQDISSRFLYDLKYNSVQNINDKEILTLINEISINLKALDENPW